MTVVQVQTVVGVMLVINMYNQIACTNTINWILQVMRTRGQGRSDRPNAAHTLWLGNFNRHHPLWHESRNTHLFTKTNLDRAQELIATITKLGLCIILPKDLPTLCTLASGNFTRPDNVFTSEMLATAIVKCTMIPEEQPTRTEHLPIVIMLDMEPNLRTEAPNFNFRAMDWDDFKKALVSRLGRLEVGEELHTKGELYDWLDKPTQAIRNIV